MYINKLSGFNEECTQFYAAQILMALEHLHSLGIIHRYVYEYFSMKKLS